MQAHHELQSTDFAARFEKVLSATEVDNAELIDLLSQLMANLTSIGAEAHGGAAARTEDEHQTRAQLAVLQEALAVTNPETLLDRIVKATQDKEVLNAAAQLFAKLVELQVPRETVFELMKTANSRVAIMRQFITAKRHGIDWGLIERIADQDFQLPSASALNKRAPTDLSPFIPRLSAPTTQQLYYLLSKQILPRELTSLIQEFITERRKMMEYIETLSETEQFEAYTAGLNVATGLGTFFDIRYEGRPGEGFRDEMRRKIAALPEVLRTDLPLDYKDVLYAILDSTELKFDEVAYILAHLESFVITDPDYVLRMLAYTNHRGENLGHRMMLEKIGIRSEKDDDASKIQYAMRYLNLLIPLAARATPEQVEQLFVIVSARNNVSPGFRGDLTLGTAVCKTESADLQNLYLAIVKHLAEKTDTDRIAHVLLDDNPHPRSRDRGITQLCRETPELTDNFVTLLGELFEAKKLSVYDTADLLCEVYQTTPAHAEADALLLRLTREGAFHYHTTNSGYVVHFPNTSPLQQHAEFTRHLTKLIDNISDPEERLTLIDEATAQEASPLWALFNPIDRVKPLFGAERSELRAFDKEPLRSFVALARADQADDASAAVVSVPKEDSTKMEDANQQQRAFVYAIENPGELSHLRTVLSSDDTAGAGRAPSQKEQLISTLGFEYATGYTIFDGIVIAAEGDPEKLRSVLFHIHFLLNQHSATGQEIRALFNRTETFYALMRVIAQNEITDLPDLLFDCIALEIFPPALLPQIRDLHKSRVAFKDKIFALPDNAKKLRLLRMSQDRFSVLGRFYDFWAGSTSPNGLKEELAKALARFNAPTVNTAPTLRARLFEILDSEKGVKYSDVRAFFTDLESMVDTDPDQLVRLLLLSNHRGQNLGNRIPSENPGELESRPPHGDTEEPDDKPNPLDLLKRYLTILNRLLDTPKYFNSVTTILLNCPGSYVTLPATIACSAGEHKLDELYFAMMQKLRDNFGNESLNRLLTVYLDSFPPEFKIDNYYIPYLVKLYEDKLLSVSGAMKLFAVIHSRANPITVAIRGLFLRLVRDGAFSQFNLAPDPDTMFFPEYSCAFGYTSSEDLPGDVTKAIEAIEDPTEKQAVIYEALNESDSPLYRIYQPLRSQRDLRRGVLSVPCSLNENPLIALVRLAQGLSQPQEVAVAVVTDEGSAPTEAAESSAGGLLGKLSGLFGGKAPAPEDSDDDDENDHGARPRSKELM